MNNEIVKNKFGGEESIWDQPGFPEAFDKFIENETSQITEQNQPWSYDIPPNELNIDASILDNPAFIYKDRGYVCQTRKVPLLRTYELNKNFLNLSNNSHIKKQLADFINDNFTHVYKIIEKRAESFVGENRIMDEVTYIVIGNKIEVYE